MNSPLLNRATFSTYPPASIFKLVTFAMGLEEHLITPGTEINCLGYLKFAERKYFCMRHWGHGKLPLLDALAYSCNIPCYLLAKKIKIDLLADYAKRFGLGIAPGSLFPEKTGLIPTASWKKEIKGESWWPGETLSACVGQSFLLTSPLQIARMIGSIFTGFLVRPRILLSEQIDKEALPLSSATRLFLQQAMRAVISEGTGKLLIKLKDFQLAAKTGTAQTSNLRLEKFTREQLEHAWVAVHFKYKDQKPLVVVCIIEHAGSSRLALIAVEKFLLSYRDFINSK
jgi:penicillin-binding protein 2